MAMCPKCLKEKPMLASHCPNCTHQVDFGDQVKFSAASSAITFLVVLAIIGFLFT